MKKPLSHGYSDTVNDIINNHAINTTGPKRFIHGIIERFKRVQHLDILTIVHEHNLNKVREYFSYNQRLYQTMIDVCKRYYRFHRERLSK